MESTGQFTQTTLGFAPLVFPSHLGSLAEAFASEAAWQAHLVQDPSLLEALLGCQVDDVEPSPFVNGMRPDIALSLGGREVVVELQLGGADPRHLGQVVRYQRHAGADLVLWLAEDARGYAMHVEDLNRLEGARVALAEVSTLRVAGGWAFVARLVAGDPLGESGTQGEQAPPTDRERQYERYWELLFQRAADEGLDLFVGNRPTRQKWLRKPWRTGSGIYYGIQPAAGRVRVALIVNSRSPLYGEEVYAALEAEQDAINGALSDGDLKWTAAPTGGRIEATVLGGYAAETKRSVEVTVALLQQMRRVFDPLLEGLPLNLLSQAADEPQLSLF